MLQNIDTCADESLENACVLCGLNQDNPWPDHALNKFLSPLFYVYFYLILHIF